MRANGHRLASTDPALLHGVNGWLEYKRSPLDSYGPRMEAHLLDRPGGKDLIRPLYYARLVRIEGVLHLAGREREGRDNTKASTRPVGQSWLCAFDPADALQILRRVRVNHATGFSAEDDMDASDPHAPLENR